MTIHVYVKVNTQARVVKVSIYQTVLVEKHVFGILHTVAVVVVVAVAVVIVVDDEDDDDKVVVVVAVVVSPSIYPYPYCKHFLTLELV